MLYATNPKGFPAPFHIERMKERTDKKVITNTSKTARTNSKYNQEGKHIWGLNKSFCCLGVNSHTSLYENHIILFGISSYSISTWH